MVASGRRSASRMLPDQHVRTESCFPGELGSIWKACRDDDFGSIVRLLVLSGARRDEIGGLRWREVDFERGVSRVPGDRVKNGRPLVLTLPPLALSILKSTARQLGREFLFGGRGRGFSGWSYARLTLCARIAEAEGQHLPAWTLHDIRRLSIYALVQRLLAFVPPSTLSCVEASEESLGITLAKMY